MRPPSGHAGEMDIQKNAGYNPAEWTEKDGEKKKIPHSTKKEEAVFASSFLFIATMSRL